jgi:hypothetical protein
LSCFPGTHPNCDSRRWLCWAEHWNWAPLDRSAAGQRPSRVRKSVDRYPVYKEVTKWLRWHNEINRGRPQPECINKLISRFSLDLGLIPARQLRGGANENSIPGSRIFSWYVQSTRRPKETCRFDRHSGNPWPRPLGRPCDGVACHIGSLIITNRSTGSCPFFNRERAGSLGSAA